MIAYYNGQFLESDKIQISPFDRGFQFADGAYEVVRYYPNKFFEFDAHMERLKYSLSQLDISSVNIERFQEIFVELIQKNELFDQSSIGYIQITRGVQFPRRHSPDPVISPTIFMYVEKLSPNKETHANGVTVGLGEDIRWIRCDIKSISLLANILTKKGAVDKGVYEIVWSRNGFITEGTHTNVAFVKNNVVITPPLNSFILAGITRKVVLKLCDELKLQHEERNISVEELNTMDECFLMATTSEITPVVKIASSTFRTGAPGKVTMLLQKEFQKNIHRNKLM
jgi:D-alanine transaminase